MLFFVFCFVRRHLGCEKLFRNRSSSFSVGRWTIVSCSVVSCQFSVCVRRGERRIFLNRGHASLRSVSNEGFTFFLRTFTLQGTIVWQTKYKKRRQKQQTCSSGLFNSKEKQMIRPQRCLLFGVDERWNCHWLQIEVYRALNLFVMLIEIYFCLLLNDNWRRRPSLSI